MRWVGIRMTNVLCYFYLQVDPELCRTVIVSTKLDTRIPQFACRADVELFLRPSSRLLDGNILSGSPFFTSVPSGRVGTSRDCIYRSNDHFREVITYVGILCWTLCSFSPESEGHFFSLPQTCIYFSWGSIYFRQ